jgi:hypothetical protein
MQLEESLNEVLDGSVKKKFEARLGYVPKNTGFICR